MGNRVSEGRDREGAKRPGKELVENWREKRTSRGFQ